MSCAGRGRVLGGVLATVALVAGALSWTTTSAQAVVQTYAYTGGPQIYVVPPGVTSIDVTLSGAQGDSPSGGGTGGLGGSVSATIAVTPGEVLQVMVGGSGSVGGFNGGGRGAGTGGGASDIRRPAFSTSSSCAYALNCSVAQRVVVAGGGGGGGNFAGGTGGAGGQTAAAGVAGNTGSGDATGGGAGSSSGGAAGSGSFSTSGSNAGAGGAGSGGASAWVAGATGGGGGGGYFGGGGGGVSQDSSSPPQADGAGGGGGGSSWAAGSGVSGATFNDADRAGNGVITIDPPSAITNAAFGPTGARQYYTADSDVTELAFRLYGGAGAGSFGDIVYGRLPVAAGQVLEVNIGGRGLGFTQTSSGWTGGTGGWNGGGDGVRGSFANDGGGGGGAADLRMCVGLPSVQCTLLQRVVVSGGGGGSSHGGWGCSGGTGGAGLTGAGASGACSTFGTGASLTAAGLGGAGTPGAGGQAATDGALGVGGLGGAPGATGLGGSGGGGGGYFGGGGGFDSGGGGGGSSYASVTGSDPTGQGVGNVLGQAGAAIAHQQGGNAGDGMAVITAMPIGVTLTASNPTQTQATIAGTVNPKFLASTPTVQYSTSQATLETGSPSSTAITGPAGASVLAGDDVQAVSGNITGLSAGTTYYYRVCAQSVAGNGCGAVDSFTTLPVGFTPPTVGSLAVTSSTATSGSFSVQVTPGTAAATVIFQCSTSPAFSTITSSGTAAESPLSGGSAQSATGSCSSLSASTIYYVRAVVTVSTGGNTYTYLSASDTFTTSAAPSPSPSGGGSGPAPSATPTPTPSPSATLPPLTPVIPAVPAAPTSAVVLVNGQPQSVTVLPTLKDEGLVITGTDFRMTLEGVGSSGQPLGLTPDGALILENDRFARTSGTGFMADTPVKLFLFSEPIYVGDVLTNAQGSFNGSVQIPVTVPPGRHTLQANGYTPGGEVRSLSLPVVVKAEAPETTTSLRATRASVLFAPLSARLDAKAKSTLRSLARGVGTRARVTTVVGYVQKSGSSVNDVQLSTQRARVVSAFLRQEGLKGRLLVRGEGVSDLGGASARRVDVSVRAPRAE